MKREIKGREKGREGRKEREREREGREEGEGWLAGRRSNQGETSAATLACGVTTLCDTNVPLKMADTRVRSAAPS